MTVEVPGKPAVKRSIEVQLLGQRLVLRAEGDPRRLENVAAHVTSKLEALAAHGPVPSSKLALLAALNIAEDYFRALDEAHQAVEELRELKRQVARRSRALLEMLDAENADPPDPIGGVKKA